MTEAVVLNIDGMMKRQGFPMDYRAGAIFRYLSKIVKLGSDTGKSCDFALALADAIGFTWNFVIAENGALFLERIFEGSENIPPAYQERRLYKEANKSLSAFARRIDLDPYNWTFVQGMNKVCYRPQLKGAIITFLPTNENVAATEAWVPYFEGVIKLYNLSLKVIRYSDGAIDIVPLGLNKFIGIEEVARLYNIAINKILVAVDGPNDLELTFGTKVIAVANAVPQIKEAANRPGGYVAKRKDVYGLAEGLIYFSEQGEFGEMGEGLIKVCEEFLRA